MNTTFWAPGRVNLVGEHTDYSGGLVLPVAIQLGIKLDAAPAGRISLVSESDAVELAADGGGEPSGWGRYVAAVAQELAALGRPSVGLEGVVESNLPRGAGLGSSGALEVVVALALCSVAEFEVDPLELALACQRAERRAVSVPSGILDQAASLFGREDHALLLDCGTLERRWVELPPELGLLVVDSGERHSHEGSGYADRRAELEAGDPRRVRHVATENERVRATVDALERNDLPALGSLFLASHASLRDDYEVSTPTLDVVVAAAIDAGALGARMTGGGFGGSVVAVTARDDAESVLRGTLERAGAQGWIVEASGGASPRKTDSLPGPA
ncbi:MAG: galactokinase [Gaiellaceae bacterium]|jgi:galactokinase|nr:galactokinase [Gaiellaceae bacterium]